MELTLVEGDNNLLEINETNPVLELDQAANAVVEVHETASTVIEVAFAGGGGSGTPGADGGVLNFV